MPFRASKLHPIIMKVGPLRRGLEAFQRLTCNQRCLPDFIVIGAQKCGTTSLYRYLAQHPCIIPAYRKEVHFFDNHFQEGLCWYRACFPMKSRKRMLEKKTGQPVITGEASPYYIFHPHAPLRVKEIVPNVRLIALLRNPIDRAYSHYIHIRQRNLEPLETFEEAIGAEPERLAEETRKLMTDTNYESPVHQRYSYLSRGIYADQLEHWFQFFPKDQLLILKSEDFFENTREEYKRILCFLGVSDWDLPHYKPANKRQYAPISEATRNRLLEFYKPHNERLAQLIGRDMEWD